MRFGPAVLLLVLAGCAGPRSGDLAEMLAAAEEPSRLERAPARVPLARDMAVGWFLEQRMTGLKQPVTVLWSVVAETDDAWKIEHHSFMQSVLGADDVRFGLTVRKSDGAVLVAVRGEPNGPAAAPCPIDDKD